MISEPKVDELWAPESIAERFRSYFAYRVTRVDGGVVELDRRNGGPGSVAERGEVMVRDWRKVTHDLDGEPLAEAPR